MKRIPRMRSRGAVIIEFVVVLPIFMMLVWGVLQTILFMISNSTLHQAANEAAVQASEEMRGIGVVGAPVYKIGGNPDIQSIIKDRIQQVGSFNQYVTLLDSSGNYYPDGNVKAPYYIWDDDAACTAALADNSKENVICAYLSATSDKTNNVHYTLHVRLKSGYDVIGSFGDQNNDGTPSSGHWMPFIYGTAVVEVDNPDRVEYIDPNGNTKGINW